MVVETEVREREREVEVEENDGGLDGGGFRRRKRIQNGKKKKMRSFFAAGIIEQTRAKSRVCIRVWVMHQNTFAILK
ncbi:hypothetical protein MTR_3g062000 [Medicago truncatula]|uniref:Uncharacterized protein n=1 Tax=Medicago truncatula TaxID=3880 RepID=G7J295_MEDTR|nr:hypothetical protein MTR_3g062000 [Medicago truncatula]